MGRSRHHWVGGQGACATLPSAVLGAALACAGCTRSPMPDPKDAVSAYEAAATRGHAKDIYGTLSERSRNALNVAAVERIVCDERAELASQAKAVAEPGAMVRASARVRYADGEDATLDVEEGGFRVSSADGLPAAARSPVAALEQLRRALARRSYAGLMRVLSPATRSAI